MMSCEKEGLDREAKEDVRFEEILIEARREYRGRGIDDSKIEEIAAEKWLKEINPHDNE